MGVILEASNIEKSFPGVKALKGVDFELRSGEVHALLGENGAGKSTLMKILSGVQEKDGGKLVVKGKEVNFKNTKQAKDLGVGIIYQELNLCGHLTVAQNIFLGREFKKGIMINEKQINEKAQEILDRLNVNINPKTRVMDLSISKQQMVEIAKAISEDADILIMDEPTSALTDKEIEELFKIVRQLREEGKGIIYISHRLDELKEIVDRVTVFRDGEYIDTKKFAETNIDEIIKLMVGREHKNQFHRGENNPSDVILEVKNISRGETVKDVSFELRKGEILGFAGLMGAGRTETARLIFGADKLDKGEIYVSGNKVNIKSPKDAIKQGIVYAPEDRKRDGLALSMTVEKNITLPNMNLVSNGIINRKKEAELTGKAIGDLGIKTPSKDQMVRNLSGGNQQKIVIGKWLSKNPEILIFDEPTRGIDVGAKVEIYNILNELKKQGKAIIVISSELPEVLGISDRIAVMCEGRLTKILDSRETDSEEVMYYATLKKATTTN